MQLTSQELYKNIQSFSYKNVSESASKYYAAKCFFADLLKYLTVNKRTYKTFSANPR